MDNHYIIHDAEKEKPEEGEVVLAYLPDVHPNPSKYRTLRWYHGMWVFTHNNRICGFRVTHFVREFPPNPPKPKRWVKKEARRIDCLAHLPNGREVTFLIPVNGCNVVCTYEIEEE